MLLHLLCDPKGWKVALGFSEVAASVAPVCCEDIHIALVESQFASCGGKKVAIKLYVSRSLVIDGIVFWY